MRSKLSYEEYDFIGESTLQVIAEANNFNKWMYETIKPYCKSKILEIGSGIGNISAFFLEDKFQILLTDMRPSYCSKLRYRFKGDENFLGTEQINLVDQNFDSKFKDHFNQYTTVFALNVIEHIKEDHLAIKNCYKLLKENGHLIILVPSYSQLYNNFDKELGHIKRYNKKSLSRLFSPSQFEIKERTYFNAIGIFGWYINGTLLKKKIIPKQQMGIFNTLVPFFKLIDLIILRRFGLSTIIIGKKINPPK
ncbi:class I SAM-dependent methyltransferase [Aestuariivivens sediminicola]|uniref:class I SAM-dependent methyltransferase n=1 Tax=Aestuariivivens sediminicola TaxID=2913560 RepID=UPI001F5AACFB|nr:class I SAM-dependent methyltransferase [Aestuariivivens sediminicola]